MEFPVFNYHSLLRIIRIIKNYLRYTSDYIFYFRKENFPLFDIQKRI